MTPKSGITVENARLNDFRTFRTADKGKDILVVGRIEMDVKVSYHHPDWDTATYDSEDKVLLPHHTVEGEKNIDVGSTSMASRPPLRNSRSTTTTSSGYQSRPTIWITSRLGRDRSDHVVVRRPQRHSWHDGRRHVRNGGTLDNGPGLPSGYTPGSFDPRP
jgi:hypothetical protein